MKRNILLIIMFLTFFSFVDVFAAKTVFIGDSRTQGMLNAGIFDDNYNVVYGVGYGYKWFIGDGKFNSNYTNCITGAIGCVNSIISMESVSNIIIWLGVNDYSTYNANTYFDKYSSLATGNWKNKNIYILSIGPVKDSSSKYAKNSGISTFNSSMKKLISSSGLNNLKYVDLGLSENSITSYDSAGIHYGNNDYKNIFNKISNDVGISSSNITSNGDIDSEEEEQIDPDDQISDNYGCGVLSYNLINTLNSIYKIMKIVGIVLALSLTIYDFAMAIFAKNDDSLKKLIPKTIKRLALVAVIFFLPILVNALLGVVTGTNVSDCGIGI